MSVAFPDLIAYEITGDGAWLCDEFGDPLCDEAGLPLELEQPGFVDVTADVMAEPAPEFTWGNTGHDPLSRLAEPGNGKLRLRNAAQDNRAGLDGYYSPTHPNCWPGFAERGRMRMRIEHEGVRRWYGLGEIVQITPEPGLYAGRFVDVRSEGVMKWYHDFGEVGLADVAEGRQPPELYAALNESLRQRPPSTDWAPGGKTLAFGFDTAIRAKATAANELSKIALSTLDYILVRGDTLYGATVFSQPFNRRIDGRDVVLSLTDEEISEIKPDLDTGRMLSKVIGTYYPRRIEEDPEVLWDLAKPIQLRPGETKTEVVKYRDPQSLSIRIAGLGVSRKPVAGDDYQFGSKAKDGKANNKTIQDMNNYLSVTVRPGATAAEVTRKNTHLTRTGYVNFHQIKGRAVRYYESQDISSRENLAASSNVELAIQMAYEDRGVRAQDIVDVLYELGRTLALEVHMVRFWANRNETMLQAALTVEPGDRIHLEESISGVNGDYFVNGKTLRQTGPAVLECVLYPELAPPWEDYWLIGEVGHSEIGETTVVRGV